MRLILVSLILIAQIAIAQDDSGCPEATPVQIATLGHALQAACISSDDMAQADVKLESEITSYATLNDKFDFVIAYYDHVEGSDALTPPLHVLRFAKHSKSWLHADFQPSYSSSGTMRQIPCLGSAVSIHRAGGLFYLGLHLSPSAQCMLVMDPLLKVRDTRLGWFVAGLSMGKVIYEHSMVHFAPTHPLVLSLYVPRDKSETRLYPPEQDDLRSDFVDKLKRISSLDRCQGANCAFNPEDFESSRGDTAVNERTNAIAFVAQFSPAGYIPADKVQGSELNENVVYVYRIIGDSVDHIEFLQSEMKSRYGTEQLNELLKLSTLLRIFDQ